MLNDGFVRDATTARLLQDFVKAEMNTRQEVDGETLDLFAEMAV